MVSNLHYRGVSSSSMFNFSSAIPDLVFGPTAHTIAIPCPDTNKVLANKKGIGESSGFPSLRGDFSTYSGSPVIADSSAATSVPSSKTQSAGIFIPPSTFIISPTTSSAIERV